MRSALLFLILITLPGLVSTVSADDEPPGAAADSTKSAAERKPIATGDRKADSEERAVTPYEGKNARLAILSSTAFPALGQLYNDEGLRTIVVFVWESYYIARILRDGYEADLHRRKARNMVDGELWRGLDREGVRRRFVHFEERETNYIWYASALLLASILDAYVFAQLHDFDTDGIRGVGQAGILPVIKPQDAAVGLQFRMQF